MSRMAIEKRELDERCRALHVILSLEGHLWTTILETGNSDITILSLQGEVSVVPDDMRQLRSDLVFLSTDICGKDPSPGQVARGNLDDESVRKTNYVLHCGVNKYVRLVFGTRCQYYIMLFLSRVTGRQDTRKVTEVDHVLRYMASTLEAILARPINSSSIIPEDMICRNQGNINCTAPVSASVRVHVCPSMRVHV